MDHGPSQQSTFQLIKASSKLAISERVPFLNPNKDKIDSNCILGRVARFGSRIDTNEHVQKINKMNVHRLILCILNVSRLFSSIKDNLGLVKG